MKKVVLSSFVFSVLFFGACSGGDSATPSASEESKALTEELIDEMEEGETTEADTLGTEVEEPAE